MTTRRHSEDETTTTTARDKPLAGKCTCRSLPGTGDLVRDPACPIHGKMDTETVELETADPKTGKPRREKVAGVIPRPRAGAGD